MVLTELEKAMAIASWRHTPVLDDCRWGPQPSSQSQGTTALHSIRNRSNRVYFVVVASR
jgi:hypothetical protein